MKIGIGIKFGKESSSLPNKEPNLEIGSVTNNREEQFFCSNNILSLFNESKITPSEIIIDLLNLGIAVYTTDQLVSRNKYGYYHWNRYFELCLPVLDLAKWQAIGENLSETLSFLSGDRWIITFRQRETYYKDREKEDTDIKKINKVSLFSGGLDSLIGAVDLLHEQEAVALVGHHKKGGSEKEIQSQLIQDLEKSFKTNIDHFLFYVQPEFEQQKHFLAGEDTQRARSFLFLTLGLAVANSYGYEVPLIVPENGLISLNIPLTPTRLGTFSTKTTHPAFLTKFVEVLRLLGIKNEIINPYQFKTKGQMLVDCQVHSRDLINELSLKSISCSKPGYYKRWRRKGTPDVKEDHCGHCVPCIIRRAAMSKAGLDKFEGDYVYDIHTFDKTTNKGKGADLHAFKIGIEKYLNQNRLTVFELLKSGALPEKDILNYLEVARNGYEEVNTFIKRIQ